MGLFVYYFGSKKKYNNIAHHTICFGNSYQDHLKKIFEDKILTDDISYYLHRPTATDPSMAPENHDAFYVLVPVPNNLSGINWKEKGDSFKELVITFSIQPKFTQSAYFRFHNQSEIFSNMFFVGAGTHPGAGMPGVLSSAKVLDKLL
jgi:phytoene desaturase